MDVHRDFCEIAIVELDGRVRSAGRVASTLGELELFAVSLAADDVVALEATSGAGLIAEIVGPHVAAVLVANTRKLPILRLMTAPGVSLHTAAAFMASVGDIRRFPSARRLVGYLGLDPRVRQSGNGEARHGRISKAGSSLARGMLGEAAWSVAQTPGPLRAFFAESEPGRGRRWRRPRPPASSPASSGAYSPGRRTTPTRAHR